MGTEGDVPHSRPPRIEDLVRLCRRLNEAGALYVVIGGFAMILHGYTRGTMDVDLLVDPAPDNIRRVKAALAVGVDIPYADVETLIRTKDTVRPKDAQDVLFLKIKLSG